MEAAKLGLLVVIQGERKRKWKLLIEDFWVLYRDNGKMEATN